MISTLRVLVLEDHAFQRALACTVLNAIGIGEVIEAVDGEDALRKLHQVGGVDVALCDLRMPGMDGVALLCQAARANLIRSIVLSSDVDKSLLLAVATLINKLGMEYLGDLGKPYTQEQLLDLLKHHSPTPPSAVYTGPVPLQLPDQAFHNALARQEFKAYFQPKYDFRNGRLCGAEVLARWQHPQHGVLPPSNFLDRLEALGLLDEVFLQLFSQGLEVQQRRPGIALAYNLEVSQLSTLKLPEIVDEALQSHGVPASGVIFEVTETGAMQAASESLEAMIRLRLMGCSLSMDDFGTGFSSLGRFCELPFNQIKLDRSFMPSLRPGSRSYAAVASAVALAKSLDISLVIEGVETADQHRYLIELGCTFAQGFFYATPMPATDFLARQEQ